MKKVILHIGTGKTGTSSIQNFLHTHHDALRMQHGVLYPKTGLVSSSHFGEMIHAHYDLPAWLAKSDVHVAELKKLRQEIDDFSGNVVILSCENLYHHLAAEHLAALGNLLAGLEVHVVCYVRRQDLYMESAWKQQVKVGAMRMPFEQFLVRHTETEFLGEVHGNYYRMLLPWATSFGKSRLHIRIFDPVTWPGRDLIQDFVQALGLPSEIGKLPRIEITNVAMPSELMRLLCKINSLRLVEASQQETFVDWLRNSRQFPNPPMLTYAERGAILRNYDQSNQQLFRELMGRSVHPCFTAAALVKPKEPEVLPARQRIPLEDLAARTLASVWSQQQMNVGHSTGMASATGTQVAQAASGQFGGWHDELAHHLGSASREELLAFKAFVDFAVQSKQNVKPQVVKPWPPSIDESLGFQFNTKAADVVRFVRECQHHKRGASVIRLGDGESAVIGYPEFTPEKEFQRFVKLFFGDNTLDEGQRRQFVQSVRQAVKAADVVGVVGGEALTKFTVVRYFMKYFGLAEPGVRVGLLSLHRNLHEGGHYSEILAGQKEVGLITCRTIGSKIQETFGIDKVTTYLVPEEAGHAAKGGVGRHYPDRFDELKRELVVSFPGMIFLVGAGPLGKVYCQWIKEKGGIALDVGSMFDAWAGLSTRKFMRTESGEMNQQYLLG